jgi:uncharacterized Fe-S cluster protein YjdI
VAKKDYEREGLTVHWESAICQHSEVCWRSLPLVFRPKERPWIDVQGASVERIMATVDACPSRALSYTRHDDHPQDPTPAGVSIHPETDGPLHVEGPVRIVDAQGEVVREGERFALCRCGHSGNKPFCDGSHEVHGFRS